MKDKNAVLIFNPKSGKGKATIRAADFSEAWKSKTGNELRLRPTRSLEDIRVAVKETYNDEEIQIFMGGDGTLSECIQGLAERSNFRPDQKPVGFLPGGTGNSFLRDFDITTYELARDCFLTALETHSVQKVDSGVVTYNSIDASNPAVPGPEVRRIMFNIWGAGLISDITETAVKMRSIGSLNYTVGTLVRILGHNPYRYNLIIDGKDEGDVDCNMITVSNSRYTGGAMEIAPAVRVNDGKLFFIMSQFKSRFSLLSLFPAIFKGKHVNHPDIRTQFIKSIQLKSKRPFLMNVDGELERGFNPFLEIKPNFFNLYVPGDRLGLASAKK